MFPQKGRSEGDASKFTHLFSIIPGKEPSQGTCDKVENEATSEQTRPSTNLRREERKNKSAFPTTTNIIVLHIQIALHKLHVLN